MKVLAGALVCVRCWPPPPLSTGKAWVLRDGDIVRIDAERGSLDVELSQAELDSRKARWKAPAPEVTSGYIWKYAQQVGSARHGAVTHPGAIAETSCYADI